jgi:hypothetical protein
MEIAQQTKICIKCNQEKSLDQFNFRKDTGKYRNDCKACQKEYSKKYRADNKDKIAEKKKEYYQENREQILEDNKIYYQENKEELNKQSKIYRETHKEELAEYFKNYYQDNKERINKRNSNYYYSNKEHFQELNKKYRQANKEKLNKINYAYKRRRRKNDPAYKLHEIISSSVRYFLRKNGSSKNNESIIYNLPQSIQIIIEHLKSGFIYEYNLTPDGKVWMKWDKWGVYDPKTWDDNDPETWTWQIDHIIPQSDLPYTSMQDENFKKCWDISNLRPLSAKQNFLDGINRTRHKKK